MELTLSSASDLVDIQIFPMSEIHQILFEIIAETDKSIPRILWMEFARLSIPNPFATSTNVRELAVKQLLLSPYITGVLSDKFVQYGLSGDFRVEVPTTKIFLTNKLARINMIENTVVEIDRLVIQNMPKTHRYNLTGIEPLIGTVEISINAIDRLNALARACYEYVGSFDDCVYLANKLRATPEPTYKYPKIAAHKLATIDLTKLQMRLVGITKNPIPITLYDRLALSLGKNPLALRAFESNDAELVETAIAYGEYQDALANNTRTKIADINKAAIELAVHKSAAESLEIKANANAKTLIEFKRSISKSTDLELIEARVANINRTATALKNNGCAHRTQSRERILADKEMWFGEIVDNFVMCSECHMPLLCVHTTGAYKYNEYSRKLGNIVICKFCSEVLSETLFDDPSNEIIDPEFRSLVWGRIQAMKNNVKKGPNDVTSTRVIDGKIMDLVSHPLYEHYNAIDRMKTLDQTAKTAFHRLYANIYVLIAYSAIGYTIRDAKSLQDMIYVVMKVNENELALVRYDENKIRGIIAMAVQEIAIRIKKIGPMETFNEYSIYINSSMMYHLAAGRGLHDAKRIITAEDVNEFRKKYPDEIDLVRKSIELVPKWFHNYIKWWCGDGEFIAQPIVKKLLVLPKRYRPKTMTWQIYWQGPVSATNNANTVSATNITEAKYWQETVEKGLGMKPILVDKTAVDQMNAHYRKIFHELFAERYLHNCPESKTVHIFEGGKCKTCHATPIEIEKSMDYYAKYEADFTGIKLTVVKPKKIVAEKPVQTLVSIPASFKQSTMAIAQKTKTNHILWQQMGNLEGRKIAATIESFQRNETKFVNNSRARLGRLIGYLRLAVQLMTYAYNYVEFGATYKQEPVHKLLIGQHKVALKREIIVAGEALYAKNYGLPEQVITDLAELLLNAFDQDEVITKAIAEYILSIDFHTAEYAVKDFAQRYVEEEEEIDAYESIDKKIAKDEFYADFTFEGGADNLEFPDR